MDVSEARDRPRPALRQAQGHPLPEGAPEERAWTLALSGRRTATRTPKAFRAPRSGAENLAQGASPGAAGTPHESAAERRKKNVHSLRQPAPSFAAPRLILIALAGPTACAVGYILMPLRGECLRDASSESSAARSGASFHSAEAIPSWADGNGLASISRTFEELSIVCQEWRP